MQLKDHDVYLYAKTMYSMTFLLNLFKYKECCFRLIKLDVFWDIFVLLMRRVMIYLILSYVSRVIFVWCKITLNRSSIRFQLRTHHRWSAYRHALLVDKARQISRISSRAYTYPGFWLARYFNNWGYCSNPTNIRQIF